MTRTVKITLMMIAIFCSLQFARGEDIPLKNELQSFAVKTGATRLIYITGSKGESLTVVNPQSYPILVQSEVVAEDRKTRAPFIVTPPLFRLDGNQQSRIKVIATENHDADKKESLFWLCLTGIPPEPDAEWTDEAFKKKQAGQHATLLTQLRLKTCLKLLIRPASLHGTPEEYAPRLTWVKHGKTLTVNNPTPFFINLRSVQLGDKQMKAPDYLPPMSQRDMTIPENAPGPVRWRLITDYGGDSQAYTSELSPAAVSH